MTDTCTVGDPVAFVESRFGVQLRKVGREEWAGPCPFCGGRDRFRIWSRGNFWCRSGPGHCGRSGWLDELDDARPTKDQILEWRVAALERQVAEHAERLTILEQVHAMMPTAEQYHDNLAANESAVDYWLGEGCEFRTIATRKLGYCPTCPTAPGHDSYTIPVIAYGKLWNIRHRLCNPGVTGKYRPHVAGLPAMLYNADDLKAKDKRRLVILEGEKKSIIVTQATQIPNVATMGMQNFKPEWAGKLAHFQAVYVAFDPDAISKAADVARLFGERGRLVELNVKADDFFTRYNGTPRDFEWHLQMARRVQ